MSDEPQPTPEPRATPPEPDPEWLTAWKAEQAARSQARSAEAAPEGTVTTKVTSAVMKDPDVQSARIRELEDQLNQIRAQQADPTRLPLSERRPPRVYVVRSDDSWLSMLDNIRKDHPDLDTPDLHHVVLVQNRTGMDSEAAARGFGTSIYQYPHVDDSGNVTTRVGYHVFPEQHIFLPPKQG